MGHPSARLGSTLAVALLAAAVLWPSSAAVAGDCTWIVERFDRPGWYVTDIDARGPGNMWAVGSAYGSGDPFRRQATYEHWDGDSWTRVAGPVLGRSAELGGVSMIARNDVWAVGMVSTPGHHQLYTHWNGTRWRVVAPPEKDAGAVTDVQGVTPDDVWAVGWRHVPAGSVARVWHWDGKAWTLAHPPRTLGMLAHVEVAGDQVTVVGTTSSTPSHPLMLTYDGEVWTRVTLPEIDGGLYDLSEPWAVGFLSGIGEPLVLERLDDTWTSAVLPAVPPGTILSTVAVAGPSDVWAFGRALISPDEPDLGVAWKILHYGGESWSEAPGPTADETPGQPWAAVVVPRSGDVAVVGTIGSRPAVVRSC